MSLMERVCGAGVRSNSRGYEMPSPKILTYAQVRAETDGETRHLLLGNGFSISCRPKIFTYGQLFEQADFSKLDRARRAFEVLETRNFEQVIRALRSYEQLIDVYTPNDGEVREAAAADAAALREVLVTAVARSHPNRPHDISAAEYLSCRKFLRGYTSINTVNYDLLPYWSLMQDDLGDEKLPCDDGFRKPAEDSEADYVTWDPDNSKTQTLRYLHGALHLFDTGVEMQKYTWVNTQVPLIEQIRYALENEQYPVFVSEGTSDEKIDAIRHNDYLSKMYRGFTEIKGSLVVFGHSLDQSDDHIFASRIGLRGKTGRLYVSIHGDPSLKSNASIIQKASSLPLLRKVNRPLEVKFFDAESASVWTG